MDMIMNRTHLPNNDLAFFCSVDLFQFLSARHRVIFIILYLVYVERF